VINSHCLGDHIRMKKAVEWGMNRLEFKRMITKEMIEVSCGRYCDAARPAPPHGDTHALSFKEDLDDLLVGYEELDI